MFVQFHLNLLFIAVVGVLTASCANPVISNHLSSERSSSLSSLSQRRYLSGHLSSIGHFTTLYTLLSTGQVAGVVMSKKQLTDYIPTNTVTKATNYDMCTLVAEPRSRVTFAFITTCMRYHLRTFILTLLSDLCVCLSSELC